MLRRIKSRFSQFHLLRISNSVYLYCSFDDNVYDRLARLLHQQDHSLWWSLSDSEHPYDISGRIDLSHISNNIWSISTLFRLVKCLHLVVDVYKNSRMDLFLLVFVCCCLCDCQISMDVEKEINKNGWLDLHWTQMIIFSLFIIN